MKITTELEQTQLEIQQTEHERSTGQQIINTTELALNVISYLQLKLPVYFNLYKFLLTSQPFPKIVKENDSGQGCPVEIELNQIMARSVILTENSLRPNELYNDHLLCWQYFQNYTVNICNIWRINISYLKDYKVSGKLQIYLPKAHVLSTIF